MRGKILRIPQANLVLYLWAIATLYFQHSEFLDIWHIERYAYIELKNEIKIGGQIEIEELQCCHQVANFYPMKKISIDDSDSKI